MDRHAGLKIILLITLSACGSTPQQGAESRSSPAPVVVSKGAPSGGYLEGDGPGADAPADLDSVLDAVPLPEPLHRYANRPYVALGKNYTPQTTPGNYKERGIASWYGKKFHGLATATGEKYDMYGMTAAHPTLPIPSYARVTNLGNKKSVVVRVNDRGPFLHERIIDLSYTAAHKLGIVGNGSAEVVVESLVMDAVVAPIIDEPVRNEPLPPESAPTSATANVTGAGGNVYLQLGAFKSAQGAQSFIARMRPEFEGSSQQLVMYQKKNDGLVRVHIGPYANQTEARTAANKLQSSLGFKPFVSEH